MTGTQRLRCATAVVCLAIFGCLTTGASQAQDVSGLTTEIAARIPSGSQMLIEADTLVYDNDANTVSAIGGVRIDYGGNKLVAQQVTYDRTASRLMAKGGVEIIDSDGTKVYSDAVDITDDFADGFVNALRVETTDQTYFAAESAERQGGMLTTFNNGVYTACKPCEEKPDSAPVWRIKARKIIWDGKTKTVRFEDSKFEFFGLPIAKLPYFEIADPTIKRKSGFLFPAISSNSNLGTGLSVPYYLALSPTYDLTLRGTAYTKQGFLGEADFRRRFDNGEVSIKIAGISQRDPGAFEYQNSVNAGTAVDPNRFRGMVGTTGRFELNPRWLLGWDVLVQTDKNFAHTYNLDGYKDYVHRSEVYLTGLNDRNFFDLRAMRFDVQEDVLDGDPSATRDKQPWVLPSFDYNYIPDEPIAGGQLDININARSLRRSALDDSSFDNNRDNLALRRRLLGGIDGDSSRITAAAEWKRSFITDGGLVVTPLLAFQADATGVNRSQTSIDAINAMAAASNPPVSADFRSNYTRGMATAGMEFRWPVLFSTIGGSHVIEPMVQVFARPNEAYGSQMAIPNEDAQSFVFDASTLFERDKFSGYDRIEGGSRANIGLRYSGVIATGWTTNALFGQSYQLAGRNSFAQPDFVNVGANSGLETEKSDYVGLVGFSSPFNLSASASARFDEQTFELRRAEAKVGYFFNPVTVTANYTFIQAQQLYGYSEDRHEVTLASSVRFAQNWRAFGSGTFDFQSSVLARDTLGLAYDDECFSYAVTMATKRDLLKQEGDERTFGLSLSFRTLGDFGTAPTKIGQDL